MHRPPTKRRLPCRCRTVPQNRVGAIVALLSLFLLPPATGLLLAAENADRADDTPVREIFVPFEDLNVLLERQPRRVLLSRQQYDELLERARLTPETPAPHAAVFVSADYTATIRDQRTRLTGTLMIDVLKDGLHAVPLDLAGVGLSSAKLDGADAAIGRDAAGRLTLLLEGIGRHRLVLEMVAPLETTAARQVLHFRVPRPPAASLRLTVPGDVEVKGGADVVSRVVDEAAGVTRFELLPRSGDTTLLMTLNSRLMRRQQAVVARSVLVDEVTEAYEKLHATVSMAVLHRAVDRFRYVVPEGFEVTEVSSPMLARWDVEDDAQRKILNVQLQEQTTDTVVLNLSAIKTPSQMDAWRFPKLQPLDVVAEVSVLGLLVERRLDAQSISAEGLTAIDTSVLSQALPATIFNAAPGTPPLRSVVAYYAPQGEFELTATFDKPPAELAVTSNLLLILSDRDQQVLGGLALLADAEKRFAFDLSVPAGWHVTSVTAAAEKPLSFEEYATAGQPGRIHVRVPEGIPAGEEFHVNFQATRTPPGWLDDWRSRSVEFPVFAVAGAQRDKGAVAVEVRDDMTVRPEKLEGLTPLDEAEKQEYGLGGVATNLAYRYEGPRYAAGLSVQRTRPRLTARTFSFVKIQPDALVAHYELIYNVEEARTRRLALSLPADTPAALSISPLDGVKLKEYLSEDAEQTRLWTVLLEEPRRGEIRLAVDFQQPLPVEKDSNVVLPIVRAEQVVYQSGLVAVEGSAELDVQIDPGTTRRVDVGELVDADYQVGRRLLGAYGFVGDPPQLKIDVFRHPGYGLYSAIVERAELSTHLSPDGASQSQATFVLRTKALFLEIKLPKKSELWSAYLDGEPIKPQREGSSLLVSLPAGAAAVSRTLRIVYATEIGTVGMSGDVSVASPKLLLRGEESAEPVEVPLNDLRWRLHLPNGYQVIRTGGTVVTDDVKHPVPAAVNVAAALYFLTGGVNPLYGGLQSARESAQRGGQEIYGRRFNRIVGTPSHPSDEDFAAIEDEFRATVEGLTDAPAAPPSLEPADPMAQPTLDTAPEPAVEEPPIDMEMPGKEGGELIMREGRVPGIVTRAEDLRTAGVVVDEAIAEELQLARKTAPTGGTWQLAGVRSLQINLDDWAVQSGDVLTFRSLGVEPELQVTLANRWRYGLLAWGLAMAIGLTGLALTNRPVGTKARFLAIVALVATLIPLAGTSVEVTRTCNMLFYAAALLVPYYLLAALAKWTARVFVKLYRAACSSSGRRAAAAAAGILLAACVLAADNAEAQQKNQNRTGPFVIQVVEPSPPVDVPEDALILPYDPDAAEGIQAADRLLVPYARYVELWNRAYPDKKIEARKPPAAYALSGASYRTVLEGDEYLLVTGELQLDVYAEGYVQIPLGLSGGVFARADLDGRPARLSTVAVQQPNNAEQQGRQGEPGARGQQGANAAPNQSDFQAAASGGPMVVLYASGRGRHKLELAVRMRLSREGGWRVAAGVLPSAPATALSISVPQPETEVRLGHVSDRLAYETEQPDEKIETALGGTGGAVSIRWRPKVAEGQVDRSLTADSSAVLDVQEDGLRLVWRLVLQFRRAQREQFSVDVPADFLLEKVDGSNVRGWEVSKEDGRQKVDVTLLKAAKDQEEFTLHLRHGGAVGQDDLAEFDVPMVAVGDAILHEGKLSIRRSPLLRLRTLQRIGVTRADPGNWADQLAGGADNAESPLGIQPYQTYRFGTVPFTLTVAAVPVAVKATASVQTVLKIAEYERSLESRVVLQVRDRPLYRVEMFVPDDFKIEHVSAPGEFERSLTQRDGRRLLSVYLATGQQGEVPILLRGTLGKPGKIDSLPLPKLEVLSVDRQQGEIAVQIDPAFNVESRDLQNCESVLLRRLHGWLNPGQREVTRLAVAYRGPDYAGTLKFSAREPLVACTTISNVRITDRAIEETILLDFNIRQAGIRRLAFTLPRWMADARISVPMLRQKTIEKGDADPAAPIRVVLQLQDEVMGELRVLVENDRLLTATKHFAPIPIVETGRTDRRFVTVENAGQDEAVFETLVELEPLSRQQKQWQTLSSILGTDITRAYLIGSDAEAPQLGFKTERREAVKTAGARIGLAQTNLVLDNNGAYRAEVTYRLDNATEQYLVVSLPASAVLWTAQVDGKPVKPTRVPKAKSDRQVRIPLVKTEPGDLDYPVVLYYGGKLPALGRMARLDFPLMHTEKISVERSQVQLFVPKAHQWFDFGGTMRLTGEEADLAAEYYAYQSKQAGRLLQTIRHGGKFAKVRAANNLKQLGVALSNDLSLQGFVPNTNLETELTNNAGILQEAQQEVDEFESQLRDTADQTDGYDNRWRLNARFEDQKNERALNVVTDAGGNWSTAVEGKPDSVQPGNKLNDKFLDYNGLFNPVLPEQPGKRGAERGRSSLAGKPSGGWKYFKGKGTKVAKAQPKAPEIAQGKARIQLDQSRVAQQELVAGATLQLSDRDKGPNVVERYQLKYQEQQQAGQLGAAIPSQTFSRQAGPEGQAAQVILGTQTVDVGVINGSGSMQVMDGQMPTTVNGGAIVVQGDNGGFHYGATTGALPQGAENGLGIGGGGGEVTTATGLASLKLQLPDTDGMYQVYRFTTPLGEVKITGRSVSYTLISRLGQLAVVAVIIAVVAFLVRLARRGRLAWLTGPGSSTVMICLGIFGLLFGFFPIAALAALIAGLVIKIRRLAAARSKPVPITPEVVTG